MTNIGYACIALGVPFAKQKTIQLSYLTDDKLKQIIDNNLCSLENIIDYNKENDIFLFRISSDLVPFGSSPHNKLDWQNIFNDKLHNLSKKISSSGIRISMHPGQYTVINSPREKVLANSVQDLEYHYSLLNRLHPSTENKIVVHIGGVYSDKKKSVERFISNFNTLNEQIKERLVIENDDKFYNIEDLLEISSKTEIPVVFDNLHHFLNPPIENNSPISYWIEQCKNTFKEKDGRQKIHYSQEDILKKSGSHSKTITAQPFLSFYDSLKDKDLDIMLEVKDKNLSTIKCLNLINNQKSIKDLEQEWARYKYKIMELDARVYLDIRQLLKDKTSYPAEKFYNIIDLALSKPPQKSAQINAACHIWGYFKDKATISQKECFFNKLKKFEIGTIGITPIKNLLFDYAYIYKDKYLLNSYYFYL